MAWQFYRTYDSSGITRYNPPVAHGGPYPASVATARSLFSPAGVNTAVSAGSKILSGISSALSYAKGVVTPYLSGSYLPTPSMVQSASRYGILTSGAAGVGWLFNRAFGISNGARSGLSAGSFYRRPRSSNSRMPGFSRRRYSSRIRRRFAPRFRRGRTYKRYSRRFVRRRY